MKTKHSHSCFDDAPHQGGGCKEEKPPKSGCTKEDIEWCKSLIRIGKELESGWRERYKVASMRHFSLNDGSEVDGIVWVSSVDVKLFIDTEIKRAEKEAVERTVREIFNRTKKKYIEVSSPMSDSIIFNNGVGEALNVVESYAKEQGINSQNHGN